jgi:hypothetical protein
MAGRRCVTLVALSAALMLVAPSGLAWAHPGKGHGHAKAHHSHVHKHHGRIHQHDAHGRDSRQGPDNQPAVFSPTDTRSSGKPSKASARHSRQHTDQGNGRSSHTDLASHPGEARGLHKHADPVNRRVGGPQPRYFPPPATGPGATTTTSGGGGGEQTISTPTRPQPVRHQSSSPSRPRTGNGVQYVAPPPSVTGHPATTPPLTTLAQLLPRANTMRFTVLPILIISVLALGVCGLIGLARHRA